MEFKKVTIRNYRIHKEQIVEFDKCLTLVGGENEKGKSTIAEAIHRALFFRANGNSAQHKSMKSTIYQEDPEVELIFLSKGKEFKLNKKFGTRGGVSLSEPSMTTLTGDEAETMLATLIQTETNITGNTISRKWPLLWVWQGVSGDNPVNFIEDSHQRLIQRLQTYGASTVLSSKFDKEVSDAIAQKDAANYTSNDAPKAGSALKRAVDDLADVKERLEIAKEKVRSLDAASDEYEKLKIQLETYQKNYDLLKQEEVELNVRLDKIKDLNASKKLQDNAFQLKDTSLKQLLNIQAEIEKHEAEVQQLTSKLDPSKKLLIEKETEVTINLDEVKENNIQLDILKGEEKLYRNTIEICRIVQELSNHNKALSKLQDVKLEADKLYGQIRDEEAELNKLQVVSASQIQDLQNLETEIGKAQVKLDTIATTFEVINSKETISINGQIQTIGVKSNFSEKFEIKIGADTSILITPGGGDSLENAKVNLQQLQKELESQLAKLGFSKVDDVILCFRSREERLRIIDQYKTALSHIDAKDIDLKIREVANEIEIKGTSLVAKGTTSGVEIHKYNADNVVNEIIENEGKLEAVSNNIEKINGIIASYTLKNEELTEEIKKLEEDIKEDDKNLNFSKTTLDYIFSKEGDKKSIEYKINDNQKLVNKEKEKLDQILNELSELSIDTVNDDKQRNERSLAGLFNNLNDTKDNLRTTELILTNNGTENPSEILNKLEEKYIYINDTYNAASLKAKAIKKLHELFTQEQQQLADKLTKPLAEKIEYYLKPVFGPNVSVNLKQEAGQFKEFIISRDNMGTFSFDTLSGGTKEQFSAAVRLAMAEVLSADFDGKLPILFDDAFTNSDENRILKIQPMLDRASQKGVQVIVLTCHPDAYSRLGAKQVLLN